MSSTIIILILALCVTIVFPRRRPEEVDHEHDTTRPTPIAFVDFTHERLRSATGVLQEWTLTLPEGDSDSGNRIFFATGCYKCHAVPGAQLPVGEERQPGPDLAGMAGLHSAQFLAESILSPDAVIMDGPGYTGPDGLSIMPSYTDSLTVRQLVDLVAFLKRRMTPPPDDEEALAAVMSPNGSISSWLPRARGIRLPPLTTRPPWFSLSGPCGRWRRGS